MMNENETPQPSPSDHQADPPLQASVQKQEPDSPGDHRYAPPDAPLSSQPLAQDDKRGSLWGGFGLFWAIAFCGSLVLFFVAANSSADLAAGITVGLLAFSPLLLSIWLGIRGRKRTALGILLGYASALALPLLLFSICTGLVALSR